jgi:hypothetical protein
MPAVSVEKECGRSEETVRGTKRIHWRWKLYPVLLLMFYLSTAHQAHMPVDLRPLGNTVESTYLWNFVLLTVTILGIEFIARQRGR